MTVIVEDVELDDVLRLSNIICNEEGDVDVATIRYDKGRCIIEETEKSTRWTCWIIAVTLEDIVARRLKARA